MKKIKKKEFQAEKYKFNFNIDGVLNGNLTDIKPFKGDLDLVEVDKKVNCEFKSYSNLNAHLACDFNAENFKSIKTFSFKMSQISNEYNDIVVSDLDKITLINTEEKSFFEEHKLYFLIGGPALGTILIGVLIYFIVRKKRVNQPNTFINMQESGMRNINMPNMPNKSNKRNIRGSNKAEASFNIPLKKKGSKKNPKDKKKHTVKSKIKDKIKDKHKNKK